MEKASERRALEHVFGDYASKAQDSERPDFLITHAEFVHGIEVTELYPSAIDAKLLNLPAYTVGLLEDTVQLHKADRDRLRVETVTLQFQDGRPAQEVRAIIQKTPTHLQKLDSLTRKIEEKAAKYGAYAKSADRIDLIAWDRGNVFSGEGDFLAVTMSSAVERARLLKAPFREMFVLTQKARSAELVYYPIRANLLLVDTLLLDQARLNSGLDATDPLRLPSICRCLAELGHEVQYQHEPEECVHIPGWQLLASGMNVTVRDWSNSSKELERFSSVDSFVELDNELIREMLEARNGLSCENMFSMPSRAAV